MSSIDSARRAAVIEARKGNFKEAIVLIDKALKNSPDDKTLLYDKIIILNAAGEYSGIIKEVPKLKGIKKIPAEVKTDVLTAFQKTGRAQDAFEFISDEFKNGRQDTAFIRSAIDIYIETGRTETALKLISNLQKENNGNADLKNISSYVKHRRAVELARNGDYTAAEKLLDEAESEAPGSSNIIFDRIAIMDWKKDYKAAITAYESIKNDDKKIPEYVLLAAADSYEALSKNHEAELIYLSILKNNRDNSKAADKLISLLLASKKFQEAENLLAANQEMNKYKPQIAEAMRKEAVRYARESKFKEAEQLLAKAYEMDKNNPSLTGDRILVFSWEGKNSDAVKTFEDFPEKEKLPSYILPALAHAYRESEMNKKALNAYTELLQKDPSRADAASAIAEILGNTGEIDKMQDFINKRTASNPAEAASLKKILAEAMKNMAVKEARAGRLHDAAILMERAMKQSDGQKDILYDYIVILSWNSLYKETINASGKLEDDPNCPDYVLKAIANSYRNTGAFLKASELYGKILKKNPSDKDAVYGFMLSEIQAGKPENAIDLITKEQRIKGSPDPELTGILGDAYGAAGFDSKAIEEYQKVLDIDKENERALLGLGKLYMRQGNQQEAINLFDRLLLKKPDSEEAVYCKAQLMEAAGKLPEAYRCYDRLSSISGGTRGAEEKLRVISNMGASGMAYDQIKTSNKKFSQALLDKIRGDIAAARIRRGEAGSAMGILERNIYDASNREASDLMARSRYDKFIANRQLEEMRKIIADYEELKKSSIEPPFWVDEAAADAYLYFRNPNKALELYRQSLKKREPLKLDKYPDSFELQLAIYYALIEKEDYRAAGKTLDELDKEIYDFQVRSGSLNTKNWDYASVQIERAWWLMFQDRLSEAEEYLDVLIKKAPYNTNILTAQAYLHFYRDWPRKALKDFEVINSMDPENRTAEIGRSYALDANNDWEDARKIAADLTEKYPDDLAVQKLNRAFAIEDMRTETINFDYSQEQGQSDGFTLSQRFEQPIEPYRKVYTETVWKHVMKGGIDDDTLPESKEIFRNIAGIDWRLNRDLTVRGGASIDYQARHPGGEGGLTYQPDDHWTFDGYYTSYSLNAPGWIYLDDGYAQEYNLTSKYRLDDTFNAEFKFGQMFISDNNIMYDWSARQDKQFFASADWKGGIALEESFHMSKDTDLNYYSPKYNAFAYVVPYVEHIWYRRYDFSILDRLFLAPGVEWEDSYGTGFAGYIRYEQEWNITDTISFKTGINGTRKNYDGDGSYGFAVNSMFVFKF